MGNQQNIYFYLCNFFLCSSRFQKMCSHFFSSFSVKKFRRLREYSDRNRERARKRINIGKCNWSKTKFLPPTNSTYILTYLQRVARCMCVYVLDGWVRRRSPKFYLLLVELCFIFFVVQHFFQFSFLAGVSVTSLPQFLPKWHYGREETILASLSEVFGVGCMLGFVLCPFWIHLHTP